ncbi:MAG: diacylglycerol kinase family protein [Planctomyces sp.]|nr:diacylglycerol kinase family protein [Planctomyces sp.]
MPAPPFRKSLSGSFADAFRGLSYGLRTQRNLRVHAAALAGVIGAGLWLRLGSLEWCCVLLSAGLVCSVELLNTALEAYVDHVSTEYSEHARLAKDVSAGAVLASALTAAAVGAAVFLPRLADWWRGFAAGG